MIVDVISKEGKGRASGSKSALMRLAWSIHDKTGGTVALMSAITWDPVFFIGEDGVGATYDRHGMPAHLVRRPRKGGTK